MRYIQNNMSNIQLYLISYIFFTFIYIQLDNSNFNNIDEKNSTLDKIYFSTITHSTIGYGDITPKTPRCKQIVLCHSMLILLIGILM